MLAPIVFADRVKDTSTSTGTGSFTLSGSPPSGFVAFDAAFGHAGNYFYYVIDGGAEWEVGLGHLSASTTLVRDAVLSSSNSGSATSFSAGSKNVFCDLPAAGAPLTAALTSDTTYNNTASYANTGLSVTVAAGGVYEVTVDIVGTQNGTCPKVDFNGGSATVTTFQGTWTYSATGFPTNYNAIVTSSISTSVDPNSGGTLNYTLQFRGVLVVNAGGTFILRSAQRTAAANNTILTAGSNMILRRIG